MFRQLFSNNWKQKRRSPFLGSSTAQKITIGFLGAYFLLNFLVIGLLVDKILLEAFPDADPFMKFNGFLIYYFFMDVFFRFFLQDFPVLTVQPYLAMPIKRNSLVHFVLVRSIPTFFNLLPLLILIPFFFKVVIPGYGVLSALAWLVVAFSLILLANFIGFYLKKTFEVKPALSIIAMAVLSGLFYLDQMGYVGMSRGFEQFMNAVVAQPVLALIPFGVLMGVYQFVFLFFKNRLYLDTVSLERKTEEAGTYDFGFLGRFGKMGEMMQLEAKMLWRSKRSRTYAYMSVFFLLYPLIFLNNPIMDGIGGKLGLSIFVTGIFAFNYAQLLLSWHSMHFDFILSRNITGRELLESKYTLLSISIIVCFVLTIPYVFLSKWFFYTLFVSMLFNIGWSVFMYIYVATYNSKKIDTGKGGAFNMEGFGAAHYVVMIPILFLPILLYYFPFGYMGKPYLGLLMVGLFGLIGIIFREKILNWLVGRYEERKHRIASDFRKQ